MQRAARSGYTGIVLGDFKFGRLGEMDEHYFANARRIKQTAAALRLDIIPEIFPIGDSRPFLAQDRNLAEGLPVREAPFVVQRGVARIQTDPPVVLRGGFESPKRIKVKPFRQYHVSVRAKTQGLLGTPKVIVLGGRQPLNFADLGVQGTQEWTEHHAVFNSLGHDEVTVHFECAHRRAGSLWWDDAKIEEVGLLNVLRRGGAPLLVKREDGRILREGEDFEPVVDPRMTAFPQRGGFEVWHEPPAIRTKLPDGTRLSVSYYHAVTIYGGKVMMCPSEPRTVELLRDQAKRLHALWGAKAYFMQHDEIRVLNWDDSCARRHLDAGAILADNVKTCIQILRELGPRIKIYVWSDMFDPHHNAHGGYYLVRGDLSGSWNGLDRDVTIVDWNSRERGASLRWFAGRGHEMVLAADPGAVQEWLDAGKTVNGVIGIMYTTWRSAYGDLERFAATVREHR
jgi:hypothetical protein